jgi:hypothetical protein
MKKLFILMTLLLSGSWPTCAQGTLIYDQQCINQGDDIEGIVNFQTNQPIGQSFVPTLSSIGFVSLLISNPARDAFVAVNLWSGSISNGILLGSTLDFIPAGFSGTANFIFSMPVAVIPANSYYLQPFVQSGGGQVSTIVLIGPGYPYGTAIVKGTATGFGDLWFKEGIVTTSEPSVKFLSLFGVGLWIFIQRKNIFLAKDKPEYLLHKPLEMTNLDCLLSQTNAPSGTGSQE